MIDAIKAQRGRLILPAICFIIAAVYRFGRIRFTTVSSMFLALGLLSLSYLLLRLYADGNPRRAEFLKRILNLLIGAGMLVFIVAEIPVIAAARGDKEPGADYVIVLGAGVNGTTPSAALTERLNAALAYLEEYPEAVAIVSGGQGSGEDISEAEAMRRWMENKGIAPERIIMEDKSTSTQENIAFSKEIIEELVGGEPEKVAIVSSMYHLYRAKAYAKKLSLEPVGVAAESENHMITLYQFFRESFAVLYLWVFGG